jgi:hypothetical protein
MYRTQLPQLLELAVFRTVFAAVLSVTFAAPLAAQQDTAWSKLYQRDLDSLRAAISANHPGAIDQENPQFARTLERAYKEASALAPQIKDFASFRIALARFIDEFEDEHLQIGFSRQVDSLREAGIVVSYRGGAFVVADVNERYPDRTHLIGARVLTCDGTPARNVFRDRVLWWRGRESIEADWYRQAPMFFVDFGPPTPRAPSSCTFDVGGTSINVPLQWRTTARTDFNAAVQRVFAVAPRKFATERVNTRSLWVSLPTFSAHVDPQLTQMRATLDSLRAFVASVPNWDLLVFDLRGNSGGSSSWGDEIAKIVFGEQWASQAASYLSDGVFTEWRLSEDNIRSIRAIHAQIAKRDGADAPSARNFAAFVDSAEAAWKRGAKYHGARETRAGLRAPAPVKLPGKIVVITTPSCFSACLDFLDRMRLHPDVRQVGQTTGVDTNYMENWGGKISDLTSWGHPLKVYRNRRRAMNEAYNPHVTYVGSLEDDAAVREWVVKNFRGW